MSEEQERVARELADQLRRLTVEDVLINTLLTVSSIGYRKLGLTEDTKEDKSLEQSRLAIETMKALTPVLEKFVPDELIRDFNASVANLQLAYAQAASQEDGGEGQSEPVQCQAPDVAPPDTPGEPEA